MRFVLKSHSWVLGSGSGSAAEAPLSCTEARADSRKWKKRASLRNREKTDMRADGPGAPEAQWSPRLQGARELVAGEPRGKGSGGSRLGGRSWVGAGSPGVLPSLGCGAGGLSHVQPPVLPSAPARREQRPGCGYCRRVPSVKLRPLHLYSLLIRTMC